MAAASPYLASLVRETVDSCDTLSLVGITHSQVRSVSLENHSHIVFSGSACCSVHVQRRTGETF